MHRLSGGLVLGFHGCDRKTAERVLSGRPFLKSQNDYDWLGEGVYFWEADPHRGLQFAREKFRRAGRKGPAHVVGAVIDLGSCLDLRTTAGVQQVRTAFESLEATFRSTRTPMPKNVPLLRWLDCAVINHLHAIRKRQGVDSVDTVRGVFIEGKAAFPGAGFDEKTHVQIAVREPHCIKGVFRVPAHVMKQQ